MERRLTVYSCGLAEVRSVRGSKRSPYVQFIHQTVPDFLIEGKGLAILWDKPDSMEHLVEMSYHQLSLYVVPFLALLAFMVV